jgi:hypothetical protein
MDRQPRRDELGLNIEHKAVNIYTDGGGIQVPEGRRSSIPWHI